MWFVVFLALAVLAKQTVAVASAGVGVFAIGFGLRRWRLGLAVTAASVIYFVMVIFVVFPAFGREAYGELWLFSDLGDSPLEVLGAPLLRPRVVWAKVVNVRALCFALTLVGGLGFLPLIRPRVLLAATVPIAFILLMNNPDWASVVYWHHLSSVPIIVLAGVLAAKAAGDGRSRSMRWLLAGLGPAGRIDSAGPAVAAMLVGALAAGYFVGQLPYSRLSRSLRIRPSDRLEDIRALRKVIGREASLAASHRLALFFSDQDRLHDVRPSAPAVDYAAIDLMDGVTPVARMRQFQRHLIADGRHGLCYLGDQVAAYEAVHPGGSRTALLDRVRRQQIPRDAAHVDRRFAEGIVLRAGAVHPGPEPDTFVVTLYWEATRPLTEDLMFQCLFSSADEEGLVFASRRRFLGQGVYPTDIWPPKEIVRDRFLLRCPNGFGGYPRLREISLSSMPAAPPIDPLP